MRYVKNYFCERSLWDGVEAIHKVQFPPIKKAGLRSPAFFIGGNPLLNNSPRRTFYNYPGSSLSTPNDN